MEKIIISCLESRVETNRSIYARFLLGPFKDDNAVTIATALRRSLLSKVKSIAITAIHIQGVTHEFSTIVGLRESVLDLALHFQQVVLRTKTDKQAKRFYEHKTEIKKGWVENVDSNLEKRGGKLRLDQALFTSDKVTPETAQIGYLQMRGPAVIHANDLKLPTGIECVDPTQYIATLSTEGSLVLKFLIGEKKVSLSERTFLPELCYAKSSVLHATQGNNNNGGITSKKLPEQGNKTEGFVSGSAGTVFREGAKLQQLRSSNVGKQRANKSENNFVISEEQSFVDPTICLRNTIFLDPIFDSVFQANYIIEKDDLFNQPRERIVLELWTNGSIHPRQALHKASLSLISTFSIFRKVFHCWS